MPDSIQRIAILGGGPAALSTAFHLTAIPDWEQRYQITIYQMGWRLGGKCASSRNSAACQRIEEHGIHLFGNFYSNTFHMMKDCFDAVQWRAEEPIKTIDQAFIGDNYALLTDYHNGSWHRYDSWLPHNDELPWQGDNITPTAHGLTEELLGSIYALLRNRPLPSPVADDPAHGWLSGLAERFKLSLERSGEHLAERIMRSAITLAEKIHADPSSKTAAGAIDDISAALDHLLRWLNAHAESLSGSDGYWRWLYLQIDFYATLVRGVLADDLISKDIDSVDDEDYRDWLRRHGASEQLLSSALPQNIINVCFHYPQGNSFALPRMSAAAYLTFILRQVTARGAGAYFFAAGTGETIVMPLYRALRQRGVRFEFFHKVVSIDPDPTGSEIASFSCDVQATLAPGVDQYQPLETLKNLDGWPSEPFYEQLNEGQQLKDQGVDLESYWSDWQAVERTVFRAGDDFDLVVLGLSIGAFEHVCPKLLQKPEWQNMVDKIPAIETQMYQLWLNKSLPELGWDPQNRGLSGGDRLICGNYNYPATDVGDFSDLLRWEGWPQDNQPKSILYFCGPLEELNERTPFSDHDFPARQHERVKWTAVQYMRTLSGLLPEPGSSPLDRQTLDPDYLVCPGETADTRGSVGSGVERFARQFFRANIDPTERYVLSLPGSASARLAPWQSGYSNLVLCGDWTYNGVNVGSVEAAVTSGMLASLTIAGAPSIDHILGYTFMHPDAPRPGPPWLPE